MYIDEYEANREKLEHAYQDGLISINTIVESEYIGGLKVIIDEVDYIDNTEIYLVLQTDNINTSRECEDLQHAVRLLKEVTDRVINNDSNESIIEYITKVAY